ncbi:MAG: hypothetical protein DRN96_02680 [Thermoproteota archaeon]|nr:MAG: hypothetical protein DRN96_02680 [Candidatus Korarchaeota archaeon]RLG54929.1 MAG: hypothetical protein DRN99_04165 [Candidatus Korarchaeota archaeon]
MIVLEPPPYPLAKAASVYRSLLESGMTVDQALRLVTSMTSLSRSYQKALRRAIHPLSFAMSAICKRLLLCEVAGLELAIDGFNVLHTIEAALRREPLYLSDDLMLRDTLGLHGRIHMDAAFDKAIELMLLSLSSSKVESVYFFFDKPVSKSGALASYIASKLRNLGLRGEARAINNVDEVVSGFPVAASSDTVVVAKVDHVLDLPAEVLSTISTPVHVISLVPESASQVSPSGSSAGP